MLNKKIEKAFNDQINAEFWSAYLYLSMSAWLEQQNLSGFAHWMYVQYQEEVSHAMKIFRFVHDRGGVVKLQPIEKVPTEWKNVTEIFQDTLKHERIVTGMINKIMDLAIELNDHATKSFLNWYIDEQVEEEATADHYLDLVKKIENASPGSMFMLDKELGKKVFFDETKG